MKPLGLMILIQSEDKGLRPVPITPHQARRIKGFIRQELGGVIKVRSEPITVEEIRQIIEPVRTGEPPTPQEAAAS